MADARHEITSLRSENEALRAQLARLEALHANEVQARTADVHLQSALAAGSIVGTWNWHPSKDAFIFDRGFARVFGLDEALVGVE